LTCFAYLVTLSSFSPKIDLIAAETLHNGEIFSFESPTPTSYYGRFRLRAPIATIEAKTFQDLGRGRSAIRSHDTATREYSRTGFITCFPKVADIHLDPPLL
jgi:hypothetical protein